ncbi:hypothetical protein A4X03_0g5583 [Tilletia caries]|uniref:Uncharacterized protein n=1 Tax=Tilletia caries TaxID=13290 RepID=A0A8T8T4P3_9BASI|nr:hypothetical protein A4X03_0g5583 [Tilletia caries]
MGSPIINEENYCNDPVCAEMNTKYTETESEDWCHDCTQRSEEAVAQADDGEEGNEEDDEESGKEDDEEDAKEDGKEEDKEDAKDDQEGDGDDDENDE